MEGSPHHMPRGSGQLQGMAGPGADGAAQHGSQGACRGGRLAAGPGDGEGAGGRRARQEVIQVVVIVVIVIVSPRAVHQ
jgi:hypothetical protein